MLSPLQVDAITLARELIQFLRENQFKPSPYLEKVGRDLELAYFNEQGKLLPSGYDNRPTVRMFLDSREWSGKLRERYIDTYATRVELMRLRFVESGAVLEYEKWLGNRYPSYIWIGMLAGWLVGAAFHEDGIALGPLQNLSDSVMNSVHIP